MKQEIQNERGSISLFLLIFVLIVICATLNTDTERVVIAEEIKAGVLLETASSRDWLARGDNVLLKVHTGNRMRPFVNKDHWVSVFYAKVCYERARLEMEIAAQKLQEMK